MCRALPLLCAESTRSQVCTSVRVVSAPSPASPSQSTSCFVSLGQTNPPPNTHVLVLSLYALPPAPLPPPHSLSSPSAFERGKAFADSLQHTYNTFVFSTALQEALSSHGLEVSNHTFVRPAAAATAAGAGAAAGLHLGSSSSSNVQECVNVHAVLHSPRGDGKEALVLVTPINHQHFNTGR